MIHEQEQKQPRSKIRGALNTRNPKTRSFLFENLKPLSSNLFVFVLYCSDSSSDRLITHQHPDAAVGIIVGLWSFAAGDTYHNISFMSKIEAFLVLLLLVASQQVVILPTASAFAAAMTWDKTWDDILAGGSTRWIVADLESKQTALQHIVTHASSSSSGADGEEDGQRRPLKILCPLAGNDSFVHYAWSQGHHVTAIDLVPAAVAAMRAQFVPDHADDNSDHWTQHVVGENGANGRSDNTMVVWKHKSQRATLYQGDAFTPLNELQGSFDAIYDKDSFGALDKHMRSAFCQRLAEYTKEGGIVYTEVKNKPEGPGREHGPPFHVESEDLMEENNFGSAFEYVASLGQVYELVGMPPGMSQMGHVLKRVAK